MGSCLLAAGTDPQSLRHQHRETMAQVHRETTPGAGTDIRTEWFPMLIQLSFTYRHNASIQSPINLINVVQKLFQWK